MEYTIKQIQELELLLDDEGTENPDYEEGYQDAIRAVLRILSADNIKNRLVIFESWSVADIRERMTESEHEGCEKLASQLHDQQLYDFLNDKVTSDCVPFYTRHEGLDFSELFEQLEEYVK